MYKGKCKTFYINNYLKILDSHYYNTLHIL